MPKASDILTGNAQRRASDIIGGLAGEIPSKDLPEANARYKDYLTDYNGPEEERLPFADWVRRHWKK